MGCFTFEDILYYFRGWIKYHVLICEEREENLRKMIAADKHYKTKYFSIILSKWHISYNYMYINIRITYMYMYSIMVI